MLSVFLLLPFIHTTVSLSCDDFMIETSVDTIDNIWKLRGLINSLHRECGRKSRAVVIFDEAIPAEYRFEASHWYGVTLRYPEIDARDRTIIKVPLGLRFGTIAGKLDYRETFVPVSQGDPPNCNLIIIPQVPPTQSHDEVVLNPKPRDNRTSIALITMTKSPSSSKTMYDLPFIRTMLPSLKGSITQSDLEHFSFHIYLGYDHDDHIYDSEQHRGQLLEYLTQETADVITVHLVRLPRVAWWSYLFNTLAFHAYSQGHDYFYQINDDILLSRRKGTPSNSSWAKDFTEQLTRQGNIGVIGPHEPFNRCALYTNAFVHRTHFEIFQGLFYAMDMRDWHTDPWLKEVYITYQTNFSSCRRDFEIRNTVNHDSSSSIKEVRYVPCTGQHILNRYQEALARGLETLEEYLTSS